MFRWLGGRSHRSACTQVHWRTKNVVAHTCSHATLDSMFPCFLQFGSSSQTCFACCRFVFTVHLFDVLLFSRCMVVCFQMPGCWIVFNVPPVGRVRAWSNVIVFVNTTTTTITIGFRFYFAACTNDTNVTNAQRAQQASTWNSLTEQTCKSTRGARTAAARTDRLGQNG